MEDPQSMRDIFNSITLSATVTAKSMQKKHTIAILNLELKHFAKRPFKIQAKLFGKRAEVVNSIISENDRITITGRLECFTYKGMDEFVVVGEKVARIDDLRGKNGRGTEDSEEDDSSAFT